MAEAAGATPDLRGLLDSNRDRAGLRVDRDLGRLAFAQEAHGPAPEEEVVPGNVLGIARTVRNLDVPAGTGEGSAGDDQAADHPAAARRARRDDRALDRLLAGHARRRERGRE